MKISVKKVATRIMDEASQIPQVMDTAQVEWTTVSYCNWPEEFPYKPKAEFRIAYTEEALLLHYRASEDSVRAKYGEDDGNVWTDSCMETFLSPCPEDGSYYNLECNCIGTVLLGHSDGKGNKVRASAETLAGIKRWSSLGRSPFVERKAEAPWEVALIVPFASYWLHDFRPETGTKIKANFYKCGDELAKPHFLSWAPITWEKPNFHLPAFFGELIFC